MSDDSECEIIEEKPTVLTSDDFQASGDTLELKSLPMVIYNSSPKSFSGRRTDEKPFPMPRAFSPMKYEIDDSDYVKPPKLQKYSEPPSDLKAFALRYKELNKMRRADHEQREKIKLAEIQKRHMVRNDDEDNDEDETVVPDKFCVRIPVAMSLASDFMENYCYCDESENTSSDEDDSKTDEN